MRLDLADLLQLRKPGGYRFLIVTDYPEFEYFQDEGRYIATHHPFTMPYPEDLPWEIADYFEPAAGASRFPKLCANLILSEALLLPEAADIPVSGPSGRRRGFVGGRGGQQRQLPEIGAGTVGTG